MSEDKQALTMAVLSQELTGLRAAFDAFVERREGLVLRVSLAEGDIKRLQEVMSHPGPREIGLRWIVPVVVSIVVANTGLTATTLILLIQHLLGH